MALAVTTAFRSLSGGRFGSSSLWEADVAIDDVFNSIDLSLLAFAEEAGGFDGRRYWSKYRGAAEYGRAAHRLRSKAWNSCSRGAVRSRL